MATLNDLKNTQVHAIGIAPPTASYTTTQTGTGRDFSAGDGQCHALLIVGTVTGTTPTLDVKIQECATVGGTYTDISGATFTQVTATGTVPVGLDFLRTLPFLRVVGTIAGTTPTFPFSVCLFESKKTF